MTPYLNFAVKTGLAVIASETKQSDAKHHSECSRGIHDLAQDGLKGKEDCFVAALLAMTAVHLSLHCFLLHIG
jgi:hypothetical protein